LLDKEIVFIPSSYLSCRLEGAPMMSGKTKCRSVDLSGYPDLVVIYLGFGVKRLRGWLGLLRIGRRLRPAARR
jgi:hypothetical protein